MTTKKKRGRGRPPGTCKYKRTWPKRAKEMAAEGILEKDMADAFGIGLTTFFQYKKKFPEFAQAIEDGHAELIPKVEAALLKTALGFTYEERDEQFIEDADGNRVGHKKVTVRTKRAEPNQKALEFFLTNKSDKWRRKKQVEHSGKVDGKLTVGAPILKFSNMAGSEDLTLEDYLSQQEKQKGKENEQGTE